MSVGKPWKPRTTNREHWWFCWLLHLGNRHLQSTVREHFKEGWPESSFFSPEPGLVQVSRISSNILDGRTQNTSLKCLMEGDRGGAIISTVRCGVNVCHPWFGVQCTPVIPGEVKVIQGYTVRLEKFLATGWTLPIVSYPGCFLGL